MFNSKIYTGLFFFLMLLIPLVIHAQELNLSNLEIMKVRSIGPAGMSGRITAIDVNLSDDRQIFVGSASGGVWKSANGGISWEPIFDDQKVLSIGSIRINQKNPDEIWVGTGEGNPRNSVNTGAGIYKSIDGGKTWNCMGLSNSKVIHRIIIHKEDPNVVFAGVMGPVWGPGKERGVFRTKDGGKSWQNILYVNDETGVGDMVSDPTNPNKIIAGMWEFGRKPWFFNSGGKGSGLYITYDGGDNWKRLTEENGLPKGNLGRIGIAFAASKTEYVYALIEAKVNGLYRSVDGGENWSLVSNKNIGNRPFYYAEIYVDPKNENRLFNLHTYVTRSQDGGKSFESIADYGTSVHPDHHAFWIHPDDPNFLIDGNDGGLNVSRDGGDTWQFAGNIPVGQFYHVNVDSDYPYNVYGGMQDNGSWVGPAFVLKRGGIRNYDWQELSFGDGFDVVPLRNDNRYGYTMSQGGNVYFYDRQTGRSEFIKPVHPEGLNLRFNWNAAIAEDPFRDCGVYFGSQFVHKSIDCGRSWDIISPDLTTNDTTKQKQLESGGLTLDATFAENHTTILSIAPSPIDENVIWVGTDDGNLQLTRDGGKSWMNIAGRIKALPSGSWIPQITVSKHNPGEAFVVVNNYRRNDYAPYLFHTHDFGKSWKNLVSDEQIQSFIVSFIQDPEVPELMFLGADNGLYFSISGGVHWQKWENGFPSVQVSDLKIQEREADLVIGTFGRSIWILDNIRPLRALAKAKGKFDKPLVALENPIAYQNFSRSFDGIRFVAQGEYIGENRRGGAGIFFWLEDESAISDDKNSESANEEKDPKKKLKEAKVFILDEKGDTIRTLKHEVKAGLNRVRWGMDRKGVLYPSMRERKRSSEPGGNPVLPGNYKFYISCEGHIDSGIVELKMDPRIQISIENLKIKSDSLQVYYQYVDQATDAFNKLKDAKKTIELVDKLIPGLQDSIQKDIKKMNEAHKDSIEGLMQLYMDTEEVKGIGGTPNLLNSTLYNTNSYLNSSFGEPKENAIIQFNNMKRQLQSALDEINAYMDGDWKKYKNQIESLEFDLFKDSEPVK